MKVWDSALPLPPTKENSVKRWGLASLFIFKEAGIRNSTWQGSFVLPPPLAYWLCPLTLWQHSNWEKHVEQFASHSPSLLSLPLKSKQTNKTTKSNIQNNVIYKTSCPWGDAILLAV